MPTPHKAQRDLGCKGQRVQPFYFTEVVEGRLNPKEAVHGGPGIRQTITRDRTQESPGRGCQHYCCGSGKLSGIFTGTPAGARSCGGCCDTAHLRLPQPSLSMVMKLPAQTGLGLGSFGNKTDLYGFSGCSHIFKRLNAGVFFLAQEYAAYKTNMPKAKQESNQQRVPDFRDHWHSTAHETQEATGVYYCFREK